MGRLQDATRLWPVCLGMFLRRGTRATPGPDYVLLAFALISGGAGMGLERESDAGLLGAEALPAAACVAASTADAPTGKQAAMSAFIAAEGEQ